MHRAETILMSLVRSSTRKFDQNDTMNTCDPGRAIRTFKVLEYRD